MNLSIISVSVKWHDACTHFFFCTMPATLHALNAAAAACTILAPGTGAFVAPGDYRQPTHDVSSRKSSGATRMLILGAKRRDRGSSSGDFSSWYDDVDDDASPDDIFWQEMERQKLMNQIGGSGGPDLPSTGGGGGSSGAVGGPADAIGTLGQQTFVSNSALSSSAPGLTREEERSADATLTQFKPYIVSDNWLDDRYARTDGGGEEDGESDENVKEIWDMYGEDTTKKSDDDSNRNILNLEKLRAIPELEEHRITLEMLDEDDASIEEAEAEYKERLSWISIQSKRLERARDNPKAKEFFSREPNTLEGFDRMWVSAIDSPCLNNLVGVFCDYGIQYADNFDDWEDLSYEDGQWSIEDVASYKARKVFEVTGLPCIASRTSFEVEPARPFEPAPGRVNNMNPKVATGYKFNNVGEHVDYLVEALKPQSDPTRVTRFETCMVYYDGEMEIRDWGVCDCDIHYASSLRSFIPMSSAINEIMQTLQLTLGLEYQHWLKTKKRKALHGQSGVTAKLRDRVLKEATVLPNRIIDVSSFMDSQIDVNLLDECAKELANRFINMKPTKILTVATTGLVLAIPMAKYLNIPCVYARKERSVVMADTFSAGYSSKTVGKNRELLVSTKHIDEDDRILIVDDFLSSGSSQDALLRICSEAGATAVGVGVVMEKIYDSGRQSLSGYGIPVESLVGVKSVSEGILRLQEEEGIDDM